MSSWLCLRQQRLASIYPPNDCLDYPRCYQLWRHKPIKFVPKTVPRSYNAPAFVICHCSCFASKVPPLVLHTKWRDHVCGWALRVKDISRFLWCIYSGFQLLRFLNLTGEYLGILIFTGLKTDPVISNRSVFQLMYLLCYLVLFSLFVRLNFNFLTDSRSVIWSSYRHHGTRVVYVLCPPVQHPLKHTSTDHVYVLQWY